MSSTPPGIDTATGRSRVVSVPSPMRPPSFDPQQSAVPLWMAHVDIDPAETWVTPDVSPLTCTGVRRCVSVPSPSCPSLLAPQQRSPPTTAQVGR